MGAPKQEGLGRGVMGDQRDQRIGHRFPAALGVGSGQPVFHGQRGVQQQHALVRPRAQVVALWHRRARELLRDLIEDVAQAGRPLAIVGHRERQALGLARAVIRVLPQDHYAHVGRRQAVQGPERPGGIDACAFGQALFDVGGYRGQRVGDGAVREGGGPGVGKLRRLGGKGVGNEAVIDRHGRDFGIAGVPEYARPGPS
ncbi:hypothetical protein D3C71_1626120 [compost metagenome]